MKARAHRIRPRGLYCWRDSYCIERQNQVVES